MQDQRNYVRILSKSVSLTLSKWTQIVYSRIYVDVLSSFATVKNLKKVKIKKSIIAGRKLFEMFDPDCQILKKALAVFWKVNEPFLKGKKPSSCFSQIESQTVIFSMALTMHT